MFCDYLLMPLTACIHARFEQFLSVIASQSPCLILHVEAEPAANIPAQFNIDDFARSLCPNPLPDAFAGYIRLTRLQAFFCR